MNIKRITPGSIELHLSDDPEQFTFFAEAIQKKLAGRWTKQAHGLDQSYWILDVQGKKITVHREHYIGVVVFCDDDAPGRLLLERLQHDFETGRQMSMPPNHALQRTRLSRYCWLQSTLLVGRVAELWSLEPMSRYNA